MSANRELVERFYREILGPGSFTDPHTREVMPELLDSEVELRQMSAMLDTAGLFQGHDGFVKAGFELMSAFEGIWFEPERMVEQGDRVGVIAVGRGAGRSSGIAFERRIAHLFEIRDGRIVRVEVRDDPDWALRELGAL
jgi:ketosteroid isomerase-like protein